MAGAAVLLLLCVLLLLLLCLVLLLGLLTLAALLRLAPLLLWVCVSCALRCCSCRLTRGLSRA
jgi:hypothetical protein